MTTASALTNAQLDIAIDTAHATGAAELEALLAERSARIAKAQSEREAAEAEWLAELDADIAANPVITVHITSAQASRLGELLPESLLGLQVMASRVKGTREQLREALGFVDVDAALELALPACEAQTDEELAFAERAVRGSVLALRRKLARAARA